MAAGAGVIVKPSSFTDLVAHAGFRLRPHLGPSAGTHTCMWLLHVAWAFSQHGRWTLRGSVPKRADRSHVTFYELPSEVTRHYFHHSYRPIQIKEKGT